MRTDRGKATLIVATLTLLVLLATLAIGVLSLREAQRNTTLHETNTALARENVRLARVAAQTADEQLGLQQAAFDRDERFGAVMDNASVESLRRPIGFNELANVGFVNNSRFAADLKIRIGTDGMCLSGDVDAAPGGPCVSTLDIGSVNLAPRERMQYPFRLNTRTDKPSQTLLRVYVNGRLTRSFRYVYDVSAGRYEAA